MTDHCDPSREAVAASHKNDFDSATSTENTLNKATGAKRFIIRVGRNDQETGIVRHEGGNRELALPRLNIRSKHDHQYKRDSQFTFPNHTMSASFVISILYYLFDAL
jgi:hypothetical protein